LRFVKKTCILKSVLESKRLELDNMAVLKIHDGADEYRIEIVGSFTESAIDEVDRNWRKALAENLQRRITIDISYLSNYDKSACKLLRKMYQHGTVIAAATPRSLILLQEITAAPRRGPLLVRQVTGAQQETNNLPRSKTAAAGK
jgi:ABC-type uncharacterized transport system substrate-binding protein